MRRTRFLLRTRRRRAHVGGVAVLLAMVSVLAASPPLHAADTPPAGGPADERAQARGLVETLTDNLDWAAAAFEEAQAHHLALSEELAEADEAVAAAQEQVAAARAAFAARAADAYRRPSTELTLGQAVLIAPDSPTAFHRVALIDVLRRRDEEVQGAEDARDRAAERLRQHQILDAGAAASAVALQRRGDALATAAGEARERLADAEASVQLEQQKSAAQAAQAATSDLDALLDPAVTVPTGLMACPVGAPNGFIDSWGFPRSGGRLHQGVDIFAARGTPLYAATEGIIQRLTNDRLGGLAVHLLDDAGHRYYYAHLDGFAVTAGQRVRAGDVIGVVGNTGNARTTPPHLHWQYHPENGPPVNPYLLARALCRG